MKTKSLLSLFFFLTLMLNSCTNKTETQTFWVAGTKTPCSAGAGKMNCLQVNKSDSFDNASWELFYTSIEGFEFKEGMLQKIEVSIKTLEADAVPADASSLEYTLVNVLEEKQDYFQALSQNWILNDFQGVEVNSQMTLPSLKINAKNGKTSGFSGCNNLTGQISSLSDSSISFGEFGMTRKMCPNFQLENAFVAFLSGNLNYEVSEGQLILSKEGESGKMIFVKNNPNPAMTLNDIWVVTQIKKKNLVNPNNAPNIEINLGSKSVLGSDGCNNYRGSISEIDSSNLKFGPLMGTKKMCVDMTDSTNFNAAMSEVASYKIGDLKLTFYDAYSRELISFKKVD
jgi:heat shock protein HslJ